MPDAFLAKRLKGSRRILGRRTRRETVRELGEPHLNRPVDCALSA
jgi:hypothetical protein